MELPEIPVMITADGRRLYRVFQNLIDNALKYALAGSRVYLSLKTEVGRAEASLRNTSREELPTGVDLTARFVQPYRWRQRLGPFHRQLLYRGLRRRFPRGDAGGLVHRCGVLPPGGGVLSLQSKKPRPNGRGFCRRTGAGWPALRRTASVTCPDQ